MLYNYVDYNGCNAICDIERHANIIIATELPNNSGASITNCAERLATAVCKMYNIDPADFIWIEHYTKDAGGADRYYEVSFYIDYPNGRFINPHWKHIKDIKEYLAKRGHDLLGEDARIPSKTKRVTKKEENSNFGEIIQLSNMTFTPKEKFNLQYATESIDNGTYLINSTMYNKIGHFRGSFDTEEGIMWIQWNNGVAYDTLARRQDIRVELEGAMTELRMQVFDRFAKVRKACITLHQGELKESRYCSFGSGIGTFYILHLIPRRGDYNVYLHCYNSI